MDEELQSLIQLHGKNQGQLDSFDMEVAKLQMKQDYLVALMVLGEAIQVRVPGGDYQLMVLADLLNALNKRGQWSYAIIGDSLKPLPLRLGEEEVDYEITVTRRELNVPPPH